MIRPSFTARTPVVDLRGNLVAGPVAAVAESGQHAHANRAGLRAVLAGALPGHSVTMRSHG